MIDDRQLLRLSRNMATVLIAVIGIYFLVTGTTYSVWWFSSLFDSVRTGYSWSSLAQSAVFIAAGTSLILRRNWLARKLIKPVRTDTCPNCDYPIESAVKHCPECGLTMTPPETPS